MTNVPLVPLYDNLERQVDLSTSFDADTIVNILNNLSETEEEHVYVLIRVFQLHNESNVNFEKKPYNSRQLKKGLKFDFNELPLKLQHILYNFTRLLV